MLLHEIVLSLKLKDLVQSFLQGWTPPPLFFSEGNPPFWVFPSF